MGLVVAELVKRGVEVRVLVRSEDRAAHVPASVERQVGDLADPDAVRKALDGVRSAFYVSPHEVNEVELATSFVRGRRCPAGVRRVHRRRLLGPGGQGRAGY